MNGASSTCGNDDCLWPGILAKLAKLFSEGEVFGKVHG